MRLNQLVTVSIIGSIFLIGCQDSEYDTENEVIIENIVPISKIKKPKVVSIKNHRNKLSVNAKKERFRKLLEPAIESVYTQLETEYIEVSHYIDKGTYYNKKINNLKKIYNVTTDEELLSAIKPHPKSIAMAQAAIESAWATSRFFREANNVFGVWSKNENEPRIAASQKRGSKVIWLKKYDSIEDSVKDYYKTLSKSSAFKNFRELKMKTDDPYILVKELNLYSELGDKYCNELASMIKYNKFYLYDE
jgi:Bax protein